MAVGQPETNLNTWGLRYVKKTRAAPSTKPTESTTAGNRASDADLDTPDAFRGRQEDSKGDKDVKITGHAGRESGHTPEVATQIQSPKEGKYGVGSSIPAGSTQGDQKTPKLTTGQHGKDPKSQQNPTSGVTERKNPEFASGKDTPADANLLSTETRSQMRGTKKDPKTGEEKRHGKRLDRYGINVGDKKEKPRVQGALPKVKAEMELAIIKCKLLKMNDISKKGEWDHLPHAQKEKERDKEEDKVEKGRKDYGSDNTGSAQIVDTGDGKPTASKQSVEISSSPSKYREDEEVTSYGTGNSGDPKTSTGENSMTEGKTTHGGDYDKKLTHGGKITQRSHRDREQPEKRTATKNDEIVEKAIELINEAYDEMKSDGFKKLKPTYEGDTEEAKKGATIVSEHRTGRGKPFCSNCGRDHAKEDEKAVAADKEDPTLMVSGTGGGNKPSCPSCGHRPTKKDAPASTGDVGAANFVYSDVKEKKKQEEMDEDDYREMKRDRARSSTAHENVPE